MKVYLETMGCQMNRLESELLAGALLRAGHEMVSAPRQADVVLYNTCSVRDHAEQKVHSRLGEQLQRKGDSSRPVIVGVLGCMAQRLGRELFRRHGGLHIVAGPGQLADVPAMIEQAASGAQVCVQDPPRRAVRTGRDNGCDRLDRQRNVSLAAMPGQAFVRIMTGCDKFCAYCVVPLVRGPERCRRPEAIVEEVRRLVDAGRTQVTLLGQTVNSYCWSDGGVTVTFSDLLVAVSSVAGLRRLSFVTSHVVDFGDDVLEAMRDLPNVCPYVHLPAQSGSDQVLRRMNRRYTRRQYDELADRCRAIVPCAVLASDFIVGFPGESEDDHQASVELIRRSGFKNSFIFKYSPRPGTAAARLTDDVSPQVKRRRHQELLAVQEEVSLAHHRTHIGKVVEVLVEGPSRRADKQAAPPTPQATQLAGRTRGDHIVIFQGARGLAGQYVQVRVSGATALALLGEKT